MKYIKYSETVTISLSDEDWEMFESMHTKRTEDAFRNNMYILCKDTPTDEMAHKMIMDEYNFSLNIADTIEEARNIYDSRENKHTDNIE